MRYIKTPNLYDSTTLDLIESGAITLQTGQWVRFGSMCSRFISYKNGVWNLVHPRRGKVSVRNFQARLRIANAR